MNSFLKQSTASQSRAIGPFLDDSDFKTPETGLTINNTDIKLVVNGGASANKNSGGGTHRVNGVYGITFDATDTATVGEIEVSVVVAGALPVFHTFVVVEEAVYDMLFAASAIGYIADQPVNTTKIGGTTQTARDLGASVLLSSGTGTGQVKLSSGYIAPNWGDVGNPTTSVSLSGTTVGVVTTTTTTTNLTNAPTNGDFTATMKTSIGTAVAASAVASVTGNVGGNVTGSVGSVVGNVGGNVTGSVGSVVGAVGSVTGNVGGNVTGSVGSVVGAVGSVTGAVGSVSGAVGSVTGNVGGNVVGSVGSVVGAVGSVTGNVGGTLATLSSSAIDSILDDTIGDSTITVRQALQLSVAALAGKLSGAATATVTIRNVADDTNRIVATVDGDGNRTAVTISVS